MKSATDLTSLSENGDGPQYWSEHGSLLAPSSEIKQIKDSTSQKNNKQLVKQIINVNIKGLSRKPFSMLLNTVIKLQEKRQFIYIQFTPQEFRPALKLQISMESNTYCVVLLCCLFSSCESYVSSFSGLSIFHCPFCILLRLFSIMQHAWYSIRFHTRKKGNIRVLMKERIHVWYYSPKFTLCVDYIYLYYGNVENMRVKLCVASHCTSIFTY